MADDRINNSAMVKVVQVYYCLREDAAVVDERIAKAALPTLLEVQWLPGNSYAEDMFPGEEEYERVKQLYNEQFGLDEEDDNG